MSRIGALGRAPPPEAPPAAKRRVERRRDESPILRAVLGKTSGRSSSRRSADDHCEEGCQRHPTGSAEAGRIGAGGDGALCVTKSVVGTYLAGLVVERDVEPV